MTAWIVVISVGVATYLLRASMFVFLGGRSLPARFTRPLAFVGPAAVAALVAAMLFGTGGGSSVVPLGELAAVLVGFIAVRRTDNVIHAFTAGLPVFWLAAAFGV